MTWGGRQRGCIYYTYLMGCLHIKHKLFSCHHQGKRDLLILDLEKWGLLSLPKRNLAPDSKRTLTERKEETCLHALWRLMQQCLQYTHITPFSFFLLSHVVCLNSTLLSLYHPPPTPSLPHLSPLPWQVETLIIDFLFSLLSSVHSLQRLPTYLTLTEQCCSRRALKDRLDCLGILIPHFFILLGLCVPFPVAQSCLCDIVYLPLSLAIAAASPLLLLLEPGNNLCLATVYFPWVPVHIS